MQKLIFHFSRKLFNAVLKVDFQPQQKTASTGYYVILQNSQLDIQSKEGKVMVLWHPGSSLDLLLVNSCSDPVYASANSHPL
ncbi:hypothetical protein Y1Q_0020257 [Alligator mississippiensis]|uniref:Uncharacterized protein n=1 Tax=Alligator mississippiensis TaxID=8496 RepID=A0A151PJ94_ALLMI|nr:hypothetical protein Y1Q_0020257 [Alligator mississippiensis]